MNYYTNDSEVSSYDNQDSIGKQSWSDGSESTGSGGNSSDTDGSSSISTKNDKKYYTNDSEVSSYDNQDSIGKQSWSDGSDESGGNSSDSSDGSSISSTSSNDDSSDIMSIENEISGDAMSMSSEMDVDRDSSSDDGSGDNDSDSGVGMDVDRDSSSNDGSGDNGSDSGGDDPDGRDDDGSDDDDDMSTYSDTTQPIIKPGAKGRVTETAMLASISTSGDVPQSVFEPMNGNPGEPEDEEDRVDIVELLSSAVSMQAPRVESLSEDEHLKEVCSCEECIQNVQHCFSNKYDSTEMMHLKSFPEILESRGGDVDAYKKENPQLWEVLNMELPRSKSSADDNPDGGADEGDGNEEEAGSAEDDETRPSFLQPLQPKLPNSMPDNVVLFGLAPMTISIMEKNCTTKAMTHFLALLDEASRQFTNNTGSDGTTSFDSIVKELYDGVLRAGYRFMFVEKDGDSPGNYRVIDTPPFRTNDKALTMDNDAGSLRKILISKVKNRKQCNSRSEVVRVDPLLSLLDKLSGRPDLVTNGRAGTINLSIFDDEQSVRSRHVIIIEEVSKQTRTLTATHANMHLTASEVFAIHGSLFEFLIGAETDESVSWDSLIQDLGKLGMPPSLLADFQESVVNFQTMIRSWDFGRELWIFTLDLLTFLQAQCKTCIKSTSDCKTRKDLRSYQYDHLHCFEKTCKLTTIHNATSTRSNPFTSFVKKGLFESRKGGISCVGCHEAGQPTGNHDRQLRRLPKMMMGQRVLHLFEKNHLTFQELIRLEEFQLFIKLCYKWGLWSKTRIPVSADLLEKVDVLSYELLGLLATDHIKVTAEEWANSERTSRANYSTDIVSNLAQRLTGKCPGCNKCWYNVNATRLREDEWNHRIPRRGTDEETMSKLRSDFPKWLNAAIEGDIEDCCNMCHKEVSAFQLYGGPKPDWYTERWQIASFTIFPSSGLLIDNIDNAGTLDGTLNVDGVVNIYENGSNGFSLLSGTNLDVEVKKGSSLIACENGSTRREKDIRNDGGGTFSDDGFICDDTRGDGAPPNCENDCPACPV